MGPTGDIAGRPGAVGRANGVDPEVLADRLAGVEGERDALQAQLAGVYASSSWRFTAPARALSAWVRGPRAGPGHGTTSGTQPPG